MYRGGKPPRFLNMKKTIILNGRKIEYELERKRVKNINLRVRADGIHVSANRLVPLAVIEGFLRSNAEYILLALDKMRSRVQTAPKDLDFTDGSTVLYMGEVLPLKVTAGTKNRVDFDGASVCLTVKEPDDVEFRRKTMEKWLRERCVETVTACCEAVYPHFARRGVNYPEIKFRRMSSRWGSCQPTKGVLTFNTALISVPRECMEYVVVHEFAHFLQPNHSALFYAEVEKLIPDWKKCRKGLGEYEL